MGATSSSSTSARLARDAELAVLMAQARRRLHEGQEALDLDGVGLEDEGVPQRPGVITSKRSALLWQVLTEAYTRLGFDVIDDDAFAQLVLARIIEPTSKADSVRVLNEIGVASASLRTMFRALQRAEERDYRGQIATACFNHALSRGDVSLVLYDVTTLYFEAEKEDELRKVGYSKERRVDPQIVVGSAGGPARVPTRDRLLRGQQGRDTHDHPDHQAVRRSATASRTWSSSPTPACCPRATCVSSTRPGCGSSSDRG